MPSYSEFADGMADLQTFNASAFIGDATCHQRLCNLILALAATHNDLHDCDLAMAFLKPQAPSGEVRRTIHWAKHLGICQHVVRHYHAINFEVLRLIRENAALLDDAFLSNVIKQLPKGARASWAAIVSVATGGRDKSDVGRYLQMVRDKVGAHYDAARIGAGYRLKFSDEATEQPLISRGTESLKTRFYFADGAIEGAIFMHEDLTLVQDSMLGKTEVFGQINESIYWLVVNFILKRAGSFRNFVEASDAQPPKPPRC